MMMMATAVLLGRPVVPMAAKYHRHGHSDQQQEGTSSCQHIVPVGRDRRHRHCVYCGLHPRHGTPWRAGGHITGWHDGRGRQACRPHWTAVNCLIDHFLNPSPRQLSSNHSKAAVTGHRLPSFGFLHMLHHVCGAAVTAISI